MVITVLDLFASRFLDMEVAAYASDFAEGLKKGLTAELEEVMENEQKADSASTIMGLSMEETLKNMFVGVKGGTTTPSTSAASDCSDIQSVSSSPESSFKIPKLEDPPARLDKSLAEAAEKQCSFELRGSQLGNHWAAALKASPELKQAFCFEGFAFNLNSIWKLYFVQTATLLRKRIFSKHFAGLW